MPDYEEMHRPRVREAGKAARILPRVQQDREEICLGAFAPEPDGPDEAGDPDLDVVPGGSLPL